MLKDRYFLLHKLTFLEINYQIYYLFMKSVFKSTIKFNLYMWYQILSNYNILILFILNMYKINFAKKEGPGGCAV